VLYKGSGLLYFYLLYLNSMVITQFLHQCSYAPNDSSY